MPTLAATDTLHLWSHLATAADAQSWVEQHLAASCAQLAALLAAPSPRTVANTLVPYDRACWHLRMAGSQSGVMFMVHPLAEVRDAAQSLQQLISAEGTALSLNRDVYQALSALDATPAFAEEDPATRFYLERTLLSYKLSGVDRDEPTRDRIRALADRMTQLSMAFSRTVQDDVRTLTLTDPNDLLGLPDDYLARHNLTRIDEGHGSFRIEAEDPSAPVLLTTDPPSMSPIMSYAVSPQLRRQMYLAYNDRGYPANKQVLLDLLAAREELAVLLGFRSWADLATTDQMMGSAANMRSFLAEVESAARPTALREFAELESFVRERSPQSLPLTLSDARFWEELFRRSRYDFDSQSVRPYFPYTQVEQGVLDTAARLFHVRFVPAPQTPTWHPSVKAFQVFDAPQNDEACNAPQKDEACHPEQSLHCHPEQSLHCHPEQSLHCHPERSEGSASAPAHLSGELGAPGLAPQTSDTATPYPLSLVPSPCLGTIYLDMHPREGKSKWFSECSLVGGVLGQQLPEASLVCNFPEPTAADPGLLQYSDVVTYFHEFGHLMHEVLGGRQRWSGQSGIATEGDFVEVPSQMLEEFFEDPDLLRTFALHHETREPLPYDTIARMTRASAHGRALSTLTQVMYATYSLNTHDLPASTLDLDQLLRQGYDRFSSYEFIPGNRMYAAFTHLIGYTSNYYTYLYDKVMALEFFAEFKTPDPAALITGPTALRYRRQVLEPGGSKPARDLVAAFLGREVSMSALRTWIAKEFAAA